MQVSTPPEIAKYLFKRNIQTPLEAATLGLYLALTAPTEDKRQAVLQTTAELIENAGLSEQDVDTAKAIARAQFELGEGQASV